MRLNETKKVYIIDADSLYHTYIVEFFALTLPSNASINIAFFDEFLAKGENDKLVLNENDFAFEPITSESFTTNPTGLVYSNYS